MAVGTTEGLEEGRSLCSIPDRGNRIFFSSIKTFRPALQPAKPPIEMDTVRLCWEHLVIPLGSVQ